MKRFFAFAISVFIVLFSTLEQANAASSWSISSAVSAGSRTVVTATKSGYKSAVNIMPSAAKLGARLLRVGNSAALLYAASQLALDGVDFVMDPANNRIRYIVPSDDFLYGTTTYIAERRFNTRLEAAEAFCAYTSDTLKYFDPVNGGSIECYSGYTISTRGSIVKYKKPDAVKYISVPAAAAQILKRAAAGSSPEQSLARAAATEMVVAGDFDRDLMNGAVPTSDNRPLIPSIPGNQNGNVTPGTDPGYDSTTSGATPGTQADAAKAAADAAKAAADAAAQAAKDAQNQAANDAADAQDLINSAADQAAIDAANARAAAAEKAAADSKAVADRAAQAAADAAKAADRAAAQAAAQAAADARAAQAAAQAAIDAVKAAAEADKAAAQAAADAAVRAADAAKAQAEARAKAAEEAAKAAEKAKAEAAKPFELPAFCSWASKVCDFVDWVKEPVPADQPVKPVPYGGLSDLGLDSLDRFEQRITFPNQCPQEVFSFQMFGRTFSKAIPYEQICDPLEQIAPWLLAFVMLGSAYFILENI